MMLTRGVRSKSLGTCRAAGHVGLLQDVLPEVALAVRVRMQEVEEPVQVVQAPVQRRSSDAPPAHHTSLPLADMPLLRRE